MAAALYSACAQVARAAHGASDFCMRKQSVSTDAPYLCAYQIVIAVTVVQAQKQDVCRCKSDQSAIAHSSMLPLGSRSFACERSDAAAAQCSASRVTHCTTQRSSNCCAQHVQCSQTLKAPQADHRQHCMRIKLNYYLDLHKHADRGFNGRHGHAVRTVSDFEHVERAPVPLRSLASIRMRCRIADVLICLSAACLVDGHALPHQKQSQIEFACLQCRLYSSA